MPAVFWRQCHGLQPLATQVAAVAAVATGGAAGAGRTVWRTAAHRHARAGDAIGQELRSTLKAPYALFGHSLGALLACELAHAFRALGCPEPVALFASGTAAPTMRADYDRGFAEPKTDAQLIEQLRTLNGTSEEVLANEELMSLTLPILRADFLLCGRFQPVQRPLLKCPVHVLGGKADKATTEQLIGWSRETLGSFSVDMLAGGHFFIHEHEAKVLRVIKDQLEVHHRRHALAAVG